MRTQGLRCPDSKLRGLIAIHPIADRDDGIQVIEIDLAPHFATTPLTNCFHFGNSSFFGEFSRLKDILQVLIDRRHAHSEQLRQSSLRHPKIFIFIDDFNRCSPSGVL